MRSHDQTSGSKNTGADDAGTKKTCIASFYKAGSRFSMVSQSSKIFSLKCSPSLVISRYFSNCDRTLVDLLEAASFGILEYLLKRRGMFLTFFLNFIMEILLRPNYET